MIINELILWSEILIRWLHVIAGIAWIGSSFYFIALDYSLQSNKKLPKQAHGEAWQVHGGGFYHIVKYLVSPKNLPDELTWFKWEAYTTLISGFFLLILVYYWQSELYLIDTFKLELKQYEAILLSFLGIVLSWVIYDQICKSVIGKNINILALTVLIFITLISYFYFQIFSGRGAFMQVGVIIGTIMVANVAMIIIPGQRKVVASLIKGDKPNPIHGSTAKQRSLHNNYLTLPVVFIMLGGHYPMLFATQYSWVIISIVIIIGSLIRHFFNSKHAKKGNQWWTWLVSALLMLLIIFLTQIGKPSFVRNSSNINLESSIVNNAFIVTEVHCSMCHAKKPQWDGLVAAPKGLILQSKGDLVMNINKIVRHSVFSNAMPPGNLTSMDNDERFKIYNLYKHIQLLNKADL